jgi:alkylation response protein AidB-like acyl-CoA dehydrogenase
MMLEALGDFVESSLTPQLQLDLDHDDVCPEDLVRRRSSEELGVQLAFIPETYDWMGGGAFDAYRICERMARYDLGLATAVFATFLGSDLGAMTTTATLVVEDGRTVGYRITGRKQWISNGSIAALDRAITYSLNREQGGSPAWRTSRSPRR